MQQLKDRPDYKGQGNDKSIQHFLKFSLSQVDKNVSLESTGGSDIGK